MGYNCLQQGLLQPVKLLFLRPQKSTALRRKSHEGRNNLGSLPPIGNTYFQAKQPLLCDFVNNDCITFFQCVVHYMWFRKIKSLTTYHTLVTAAQITWHLRDNCSSINATNVVTIQANMMAFYDKTCGISQYINILEESKEIATRAGLPITNNDIIDISNWVIIAPDNYPNKTKVFNKLLARKLT